MFETTFRARGSLGALTRPGLCVVIILVATVASVILVVVIGIQAMGILDPPATGMATDLGIGSVGKEIGMVERGITTDCVLFLVTGGGRFCSSSTGWVLRKLLGGKGCVGN